MAGSVAGVREYPGTWAEFLAWFPDEAACARYLERPHGLRVGRRRGVHGLAASLTAANWIPPRRNPLPPLAVLRRPAQPWRLWRRRLRHRLRLFATAS